MNVEMKSILNDEFVQTQTEWMRIVKEIRCSMSKQIEDVIRSAAINSDKKHIVYKKEYNLVKCGNEECIDCVCKLKYALVDDAEVYEMVGYSVGSLDNVRKFIELGKKH